MIWREIESGEELKSNDKFRIGKFGGTDILQHLPITVLKSIPRWLLRMMQEVMNAIVY